MEGDLTYITIPRKVASDYRNRLLSRHERDVYVWIRMIANPYGIATIDLESLAADCFGRVDKNYANKIILSLKRKRYIFYKQRSGSRGSFEVHVGDWITPYKGENGKPFIKQIDEYFDNKSIIIGTNTETSSNKSEVLTEVAIPSQKSAPEKKIDFSEIFDLSQKMSIRASYNDKDTYTKKDDYRTNRTFKNKTPVADFSPKSYEEERCHAIALAIGDEYMDFILGSLRKHGFSLIERAWKYCKEAKQYSTADNKAAFFNKILQDFVVTHVGDSQTF